MSLLQSYTWTWAVLLETRRIGRSPLSGILGSIKMKHVILLDAWDDFSCGPCWLTDCRDLRYRLDGYGLVHRCSCLKLEYVSCQPNEMTWLNTVLVLVTFCRETPMGRSLVRGALNDKLFGGAEGAEPHDELREELLERWPCSAVGTDVVLGCACREVFVRR